jgi:site-specific recombinase XerD
MEAEIIPPPCDYREVVSTALEPVLHGSPDSVQAGHPLWNAVSAVAEFAAHAQAKNTTSAYESDWRHFVAWCADKGLTSMPSTPMVVSLYIGELAKGGWRGEPARKISTVERRLAAINAFHKRAGKFLPASQKHPEISMVIQGISRMKGRAPKSKRPIRLDQIPEMIAAEGGHPLAAARDKVILLLGFAVPSWPRSIWSTLFITTSASPLGF